MCSSSWYWLHWIKFNDVSYIYLSVSFCHIIRCEDVNVPPRDTFHCGDVHVSPKNKFECRSELISTCPDISSYKSTSNIKEKNKIVDKAKSNIKIKNKIVHTPDDMCKFNDKNIVKKGK